MRALYCPGQQEPQTSPPPSPAARPHLLHQESEWDSVLFMGTQSNVMLLGVPAWGLPGSDIGTKVVYVRAREFQSSSLDWAQVLS